MRRASGERRLASVSRRAAIGGRADVDEAGEYEADVFFERAGGSSQRRLTGAYPKDLVEPLSLRFSRLRSCSSFFFAALSYKKFW